MVYGVKIKNDKIELQIDGEYINYSLAESISSASSNAEQSHNFTTNTRKPPLVLIQPPTNGISFIDLNYSSPNYTGFTVFGAAASTFNWKIYTATQERSSDTYGYRIFNDKSDLVFDSAYEYFKINSVISATIGNTYNHASISDPYYIFTPNRMRLQVVPVGGGNATFNLYQGAIYKISSTQVKFDWMLIFSQLLPDPGASDQNTGTTCTIVVCDTTTT